MTKITEKMHSKLIIKCLKTISKLDKSLRNLKMHWISLTCCCLDQNAPGTKTALFVFAVPSPTKARYAKPKLIKLIGRLSLDKVTAKTRAVWSICQFSALEPGLMSLLESLPHRFLLTLRPKSQNSFKLTKIYVYDILCHTLQKHF